MGCVGRGRCVSCMFVSTLLASENSARRVGAGLLPLDAGLPFLVVYVSPLAWAGAGGVSIASARGLSPRALRANTFTGTLLPCREALSL